MEIGWDWSRKRKSLSTISLSLSSLLLICVESDTDGRLNMRTAHGIYRTLQLYVEEADKGGFDEEIDMDFRSVSPPSPLYGIS